MVALVGIGPWRVVGPWRGGGVGVVLAGVCRWIGIEGLIDGLVDVWMDR